MRDKQRTVKIELLSQWKLEAEFRNFFVLDFIEIEHLVAPKFANC